MTRRAKAKRAALRRGEGWCDREAVARFSELGLRVPRIWNCYELRELLGADLQTTAVILEEVATEHRWLKLRDSNGMVRAITLPKNHRLRGTVDLTTHRAAMLELIVRQVRLEELAA